MSKVVICEHPEAKHHSFGLCYVCYGRKRRAEKPDENKAASKRWRDRNVEISRQKTREWNRSKPDVMRNYALLNKYKISLEQFNEMKTAQGGRCFICREAKAVCVDHNHATGEVRAILCNACNSSLGYVREQEQILKNMIDYLQGFGANPTTLQDLKQVSDG